MSKVMASEDDVSSSGNAVGAGALLCTPTRSHTDLPLRTASTSSPYSPAKRGLFPAGADAREVAKTAGGPAASTGRACARPMAKRTLLELEADTGKTGMHLPNHLPADFPRGPWLVDDKQDGKHKDGWLTMEERWLHEMQVWASNPATPTSADSLFWRRGSFKLSGLNRQPPSDGSKFGTCKSAACVGGGRRMVLGCSGVGEPSSDWYASDEKHKGKVGSCDFTIKCEFVLEANGQSGEAARSGWVTKYVSPGQHILKKEGCMHELVTNAETVMNDGGLRKGAARLKVEPYFGLGNTMKEAGMGVSSIYSTLAQKAEEEGETAQFSRDDVRRVFGITIKEEMVDCENLLHLLEERGCYHQVSVVSESKHRGVVPQNIRECNTYIHRWGLMKTVPWTTFSTPPRHLYRASLKLKVLVK